MARKTSGSLFTKSLFVIPVLGFAIVITLLAVNQKTQTQQNASGDTDINTFQEITTTNNADGTMGPVSALANFSNTLPGDQVGRLQVNITDPMNLPTGVKGKGPVIKINHGNSKNSGSLSAGGEDNEDKKNQDNGPVSVTSIMLTLSKAEVHLANTKGCTEIADAEPDQTKGNKPGGIKGADKWEVLQLDEGSEQFDLFELAQGKTDILGLTTLACGKYTEIRLYIADATATLSDGTTVKLSIPGRANIVRIVRPFTITSGQPTVITIDFDGTKSVINSGSSYFLKPVIARVSIGK